MGIQAQLDQKALDCLTKTKAYITKIGETDKNRAGHHISVAIRLVLNNHKALNKMTEQEIAELDQDIADRLHYLDNN